MADIDLKKAVVERVRNAVHSLQKELATAGVDVSPVVVEEIANGITVTVTTATKTRRNYKTDPVVVTPGNDPVFGENQAGLLVDLAEDDDVSDVSA